MVGVQNRQALTHQGPRIIEVWWSAEHGFMQSILLVRSTDGFARALGDAFSSDSISIYRAVDSRHGLELSGRLKPSVVVLGDECPVAELVVMLHKLRSGSSSRQTPVIAVLDRENKGDLNEAYRIGAADAILWPCGEDELYIRFRNVLERVRLQELLEKAAQIDPLTGLNTRSQLDRQLKERCAVLQRYGQRFALVLVEADDFQKIRRLQGCVAGERLLQRVAHVLDGCMREEESLYRFAESAFGVVLFGCDLGGAHKAAERFLKTLKNADHTADIATSFGVATCESVPIGYPVHDGILQAAASALSQAKESGGNRVHHFSGVLQPDFALAQ